jgi:type II secretory pathway pseudopilin PulG
MKPGKLRLRLASPAMCPVFSASSAPLRCKSHGRAGFSLVEMLVVIALTIILMGLLLGPLSQTFNLTSRGRTMVAAQDNARFALQRISRDLSDAMLVVADRPLNIWHYSKYAPADRPSPSPDAVPVAQPTTAAMIDLVLPKMRYFCTYPSNPHYLLDSEVPPNVAIDTCPRPEHAGAIVERRPLEPLQPEHNIIRYFIGLRDPVNATGSPDQPAVLYPGANSDLPHYLNGFLFPNTAGGYDNPYVLYRVEFDPNDPTVGNWRLPDGTPNPNFFYDTAQAPGTDHSFAAEWRSRTVAVISPVDTDAIRLVKLGDTFQPEPLIRFGASPIENESLDPNRNTALIPSDEAPASGSTGEGGTTGATTPRPSEPPRSPTQYVADFGHWTGPANETFGGVISAPLVPGLIVGSETPPTPAEQNRFRIGPRIQVYERRPQTLGGDDLVLVFDSGVAQERLPRQRLLTWDARRGIVNFALKRTTTSPITGEPDPNTFVAKIDGNFSADLKKDTATAVIQGATLPGGFGAVVGGFPVLAPSARIVPGSELVSMPLGGDTTRVTRMQRIGFTGLGPTVDRVVAQADLQPNEYTINYQTGVIQFSDRDPSLIGQPVAIQYQWQTNRPTDVVRVSYATRELMTISMGLLQYEPRTGEPQSVQLSTRVRVRNLAR